MLKETPKVFTETGRADFYIDPWEPVERAVMTHAHGDHARPGSAAYLCTPETAALLRRRFGPTRSSRRCPYGKPLTIGDVRVSFHPAGHVLGSAQIRIEGPDGVWVVAGRLQARGGSHLRAVRARAVRHLHHRVHLRPADLPLGRDGGGRSPTSSRGGTRIARRANIGDLLLHDRQGAAATRGAGAPDRPAGVRARHAARDDRRLPRSRRALA